MARLNQNVDNDDDLPELSTIFRRDGESATNAMNISPVKQDKCKDSKEKDPIQEYANVTKDSLGQLGMSGQLGYDREGFSRQRRLGQSKSNQLRSHYPPVSSRTKAQRDGNRSAERGSRSRPRTRTKPDASIPADASISLSEDDDSSTDLSGFIVPDSASEEDLFLPRWRKKSEVVKLPSESRKRMPRTCPTNLTRSPVDDMEAAGPIDLTSPQRKNYAARIDWAESPPRLGIHGLSGPPDTCSGSDEPLSKLILCVRSSR